jgi:hypothetical protein
MTAPRPPRRPLTDAEIAARLQRAYEILYQAGLRAQQREAAEGRPQLHLVPPPEPSTPQQPLDNAARRGGEMKDPGNDAPTR